jgi:hypothetical protein
LEDEGDEESALRGDVRNEPITNVIPMIKLHLKRFILAPASLQKRAPSFSSMDIPAKREVDVY